MHRSTNGLEATLPLIPEKANTKKDRLFVEQRYSLYNGFLFHVGNLPLFVNHHMMALEVVMVVFAHHMHHQIANGDGSA